MNILTFDTEEWYLKKTEDIYDNESYQEFDRYLKSILDLLDEQNIKATFFCVGGLAKFFPEVVTSISDKGHEIGCHSNTHAWLSAFDRKGLTEDTQSAIKSLEDVSGKKVMSYRAPAFSIGEKNKWALEVFAECGIQRDASLYPAVRDFGGFADFPSDTPCIININGATIKEFPICLASALGKKFAFSGGGYFRFFPLWYVKHELVNSNYGMCYFHINDMTYRPFKMMDKAAFEEYFKEPGTFKNRFVRSLKWSLGTREAFNKMCRLVRSMDFVNLEDADRMIDWSKAKTIEL